MTRSLAARLRQHLRTSGAAYAVLAVGLAATGAAHAYVARVVAAEEHARLREVASAAADAVHDRVEAYVATLRAMRGMFHAGREPSRAEFHDFVQAIELGRYYPGVQGVGYAKLLGPGEVAGHEAAVRAEGFPEYRVWPEGPRDAYTAILYLEPFDWRNRRALGFDMASEPVRREAMARARSTGRVAASGPVELVQEVGEARQLGFLMYVPVHLRQGTAIPGEGRILGWVYAPFRAGDLLEATLAGEPLDAVAVEVREGEPGRAGPALYRSPSCERVRRGAGTVELPLEVAGRGWTLRAAATPAFEAGARSWLPKVVAGLGLVASFLLFALTQGEARVAADARRAAQRSRFLAEASKALSSSLEYRATLAQVASLVARERVAWCAVILAEPEGPVALVGHADEARAAAATADLAALLLHPGTPHGAAAAMARGEVEVGSLGADALERAGVPPAAREAARALGLRAALSAPLRARSETLGCVTLLAAEGDRPFDAADVASSRDLARLAAAAVDTSRLYARARDAVRVRDDFLSIASHELKTPLTSLLLQVESLGSPAVRAAVPESVGRKVDIVRRNVERLARLVDSLLDISRVAAGRIDLQVEELDLAELVREVAARFETELARAGCALRLDLPPSLAARSDRLRLDQVVTNLLSNAVKYGPGKPIEVALRALGGRAALTVRDGGIGIAPEAQARIFERFERAVSDRHYGGFGLGLWIVRRILEALAGEIRVESAPGAGATFVVELPLAPLAEAAPGPGSA